MQDHLLCSSSCFVGKNQPTLDTDTSINHFTICQSGNYSRTFYFRWPAWADPLLPSSSDCPLPARLICIKLVFQPLLHHKPTLFTWWLGDLSILSPPPGRPSNPSNQSSHCQCSASCQSISVVGFGLPKNLMYLMECSDCQGLWASWFLLNTN
jgi:hypothetical protein